MQLPDRSFKDDMTRFIRERPILGQECGKHESEVKALRAVAGSLSWTARQCRPDKAGAASTLRGSASRAVVEDPSDANRALNRLKQTEDVGLLTHTIPLVNLRTVSISDATLDQHGGFIVGFTTLELHQQGSAAMSPVSWSSPKVKRSCVRTLGWRGLHDERRAVRMRMDQRCFGVSGLSGLRAIGTPTEIDITAYRAHSDPHESRQPFSGRSVHGVCHRCEKRILIIWYESPLETIAGGQHKSCV